MDFASLLKVEARSFESIDALRIMSEELAAKSRMKLIQSVSRMGGRRARAPRLCSAGHYRVRGFEGLGFK
eukprot:653153-Pyramimonas_sp.AAC.2